MSNGLKKTIIIGLPAILAIFTGLVLWSSYRNINITPEIDQVPRSKIQKVSSETNINLTTELASKFTETILKNNPEGISDGVLVSSPDEIARLTIEEKLQDFDPSFLIPKVGFTEFTIIVNPVNKDYSNYFQRYALILHNNVNSENMILTTKTIEMNDFSTLIKGYSTAINQLYSIPVPEDLVFMHQQTMTLLGTQENIFRTLAKYEEDPLKALYAASMYDWVVEEAELLQEYILEYISRNNIKFEK
ncbi:MAG: hypothetical protein COU06_01160 [Candidatus Harrisonbacteria bacterium CG10_big_fil_rev_8_21_14_0_10_38_8]|uniref:Uncharacterized protein n=1 Tax=Candidatus Harrisonbacteria bacterium CG10_big_fil_rev_8_21_14_0_10_38_8 TaxID=1974582 RepID=A0A2M6WK82_9BACT|nr:MAG: hypothetical protein COU06_01160 [Candidatus Harrisonbacteria bacterium CG10_big_fil_rev_8_21_14_0_10_38_8]